MWYFNTGLPRFFCWVALLVLQLKYFKLLNKNNLFLFLWSKQRKFQSQRGGLPHSTVPCPFLVMPSTRVISDKYQSFSHWFDSAKVCTMRVQIAPLATQEEGTQLIWSSHLGCVQGTASETSRRNLIRLPTLNTVLRRKWQPT